MHVVEEPDYTARRLSPFQRTVATKFPSQYVLDPDAFDGGKMLVKKSDHSVPPDSFPTSGLKGNIRGEGYLGYVLARQTSQISLYNWRCVPLVTRFPPEFAEVARAGPRSAVLPKIRHDVTVELDTGPPAEE